MRLFLTGLAAVVVWLAWDLSHASAAFPHLAHIHSMPSKIDCCPPTIWYAEGPPWLKFKKACPRPVCATCDLEHNGYYQSCWQSWQHPADYRHCNPPHIGEMLPPPAIPPYTPRTQQVQPYVAPTPVAPKTGDTEVLPSPRKTDTGDTPSVRLLPSYR